MLRYRYHEGGYWETGVQDWLMFAPIVDTIARTDGPILIDQATLQFHRVHSGRRLNRPDDVCALDLRCLHLLLRSVTAILFRSLGMVVLERGRQRASVTLRARETRERRNHTNGATPPQIQRHGTNLFEEKKASS